MTDEGYRDFVHGLQEDYERRQPAATIINAPEQIRARQALDAKLDEWWVTNLPPAAIQSDTPGPLRDALRKAMEELNP